jgi:hypothetical protein
MIMHGTLIFTGDVKGFAEYIDLAVAKVKFIPLDIRALMISAVFVDISPSELRSVPSRSVMYSLFNCNSHLRKYLQK